jgi:uncharacterized protein YeaO (DUF488 family)
MFLASEGLLNALRKADSMIRVDKSVYDRPTPSDGKRVLVMRLWPRGITKDSIDVWEKDLGTPRELIAQWKGGKITWKKFASEYKKSLRGKEVLLRSLAEESRKGTILLLCTERDPKSCHRSVLKEVIEEHLPVAQ